jgi:hypothetical protein
MNKTISINPELFKFTSSKRKSRKKEPENNSEIKIKPPISETQKRKQLRKQSILRHLREQQEKNYKQLMENDEPKRTPKPISDDFQSDFKESIDYFKNLAQSKPTQKHNFTSKIQHETSNVRPQILQELKPSLEPLIHNNSFEVVSNSEPIQLSKPVLNHSPAPTWGCLKNGNLPTFRDWKQSTQKVNPLHNMSGNSENISHIGSQIQSQSGGGENMDKKYQILTTMKANKEPEQPKLKYRKQKKTIRRTYKVGRSKVFSKIAVLISNKTIRNNIMNKAQQLKQMPIEDVRRHLIKYGFIRVGSSAPNDVLRKMYETTKLICGEVENHNTDNLLYNYLNDV